MSQQTAAIAAAEQQQDALRPLRQFITALSVLTSDQSWAGQDAYAVNPVYQYQTVGQYGSAVEGTPLSTGNTGTVNANAQGVVIPQGVILLALGAAAVYFFVK